jgi:hypothetical protein
MSFFHIQTVEHSASATQSSNAPTSFLLTTFIPASTTVLESESNQESHSPGNWVVFFLNRCRNSGKEKKII